MPVPTTRLRKLAFGVLTTVVVLGSLECAARVYSAVRFHNPRALAHGLPFVRHVFAGSVESPTAAPDWQALQRDTDDLFAHRRDPDVAQGAENARTITISGGRTAHLNSLGLRGPEVTRDPAPGYKRIVAFGGSYVFGDLLSDEEAWPSVLGAQLRRRGLPLEVLNAGSNGGNIHHVVKAAVRLTSRGRVDYLLVTVANNTDDLVSMTQRFTLARRLQTYLYNVSMFDVILTEKLSRLGRQPLDYGLYRQKAHVDPAAVATWLEIYRTRLGQLATIARERRATLILASNARVFYEARVDSLKGLDADAAHAIGQQIGRHEDVWTQELEYYLHALLNLEAQRFARDNPDVRFFDGSSVLEADKARFFEDWVHPSPAGAAALASALADYFATIAGPAAERPR